MKNRRSFLIAAGAAGVTAALARRSERSAALAASAKAPSAAAVSLAAGFRRIDPKLAATDLEAIARGIDDAAQAAAALRPKRRPLRNADEPVTIFVVPLE